MASALSAAPVPVQTFKTSAGAVEITPIYHASAMIKAGGDTIYIDPAPPANISGLKPGGLILITDIHPDHLNMADITALSDEKPTSLRQRQCRQRSNRQRPSRTAKARSGTSGRSPPCPCTTSTTRCRTARHIIPKAEVTVTSSRMAARISTLPETPRAYPKCAPEEHRCCIHPDESALHHDAGRRRRRGESIQAEGRDSLPLSRPGCAEIRRALKGTGIEVRLLDWYSNAIPAAH